MLSTQAGAVLVARRHAFRPTRFQHSCTHSPLTGGDASRCATHPAGCPVPRCSYFERSGVVFSLASKGCFVLACSKLLGVLLSWVSDCTLVSSGFGLVLKCFALETDSCSATRSVFQMVARAPEEKSRNRQSFESMVRGSHPSCCFPTVGLLARPSGEVASKVVPVRKR